MTHPSVYPFVFIRSDCEMPQPSGAGNRWSRVLHQDQKARQAVQAFQCLVCRHYKHPAAVYVSCSLRCFQVRRPNGGAGQGAR